MTLTIDEVAKVALLARLRLSPEELQTVHRAAQLDRRLRRAAPGARHPRRGAAGARDRGPQRVPRRRARAGAAPRAGAGQRTRAERRGLPGPRRPRITGPGVAPGPSSATRHPGPGSIADGFHSRHRHRPARPVERGGHDVGGGRPRLPRPRRPARPAQRVRPPRAGGRAGAGPRHRRAAQGGRAARAAGGRPGRDQGRALRRGGADHLRQPDAQELPAPLRRHGDRAAQGRRRRSSSARPTWTSSRWARPPRPAPTARR